MAKAKKKRESVQHVLDHAPKTKSFVTKLNGSSKFEIVTLKDDEAKEEWLILSKREIRSTRSLVFPT